MTAHIEKKCICDKCGIERSYSPMASADEEMPCPNCGAKSLCLSPDCHFGGHADCLAELLQKTPPKNRITPGVI